MNILYILAKKIKETLEVNLEVLWTNFKNLS